MDNILRPYQHALSLGVRRLLAKNKRVILQSPTGAGKTMVACHLLYRSQLKNLCSVFLTDRIELVQQAMRAVDARLDFRVQQITRETKEFDEFANLYVGMVETFHRRQSSGKFSRKVDLFVLDEAHMGAYFKIIDQNPEAMVIGLTATPVSSSAQYALTDYYQGIYVGPTVSELIEQKFLCPVVENVSFDILNINSVRGEFTDDSQKSELARVSSNSKILRKIKENPGRRWIVFNVDVAHSISVTSFLKRNGINCEHVDSKSEDREEKIADFQRGNIHVLCNVGILTKGYDDPGVSGIILNHSTQSLSKYFQEIGRGSRIFQGKENFLVYDLGNNIFRHGSYTDPVDWMLIFRQDAKDKSQNFRNCNACKVCGITITNKFLKNCPVCNAAFPDNLFSLVNEVPEELRKNPSEMSMSELSRYGKIKGYKPGWAWVQNRKNMDAKQKGYSVNWSSKK